jgi:acetyltransferase-like isoleucine patch superfamily enzyme
MMLFERIWRALQRTGLVLHTVLVRRRFAAWGARSRIDAPVRLESPHLVQVGARVRICEHAWLNACDDRGDGQPTLRVGDGTYIGRFAHINAWRNVSIGRDVLIADRVYISDCEHGFTDISQPVIAQGDVFRGDVVLKDGCWLGIGVVILPGVTIGRNAVVAANSVVNRDVDDFTVVGGAPARFIKTLAPA